MGQRAKVTVFCEESEMSAKAYLEGGPVDGSTRWDKGPDLIKVEAPGIPDANYVYVRTDREQNGYTVFEYQPT